MGVVLVVSGSSFSLIWLISVGSLFWGLTTQTHAEEISFRDQVIPILTKAGCNSGACHGAAVGRGTFRLSLYGQNPEQDWQSLARELGGKRINRSSPADSLLLRKASETIEHGGGERLPVGSRLYNELSDWVAQGAKREPATADINSSGSLLLEPNQLEILSGGPAIPLRVWYVQDDGKRVDVSSYAIVTPLDVDAVRVIENPLSLVPLRRGRHVVLARVGSRLTTGEYFVLGEASSTAPPLSTPLEPAPSKSIGTVPRSFIDIEIEAIQHKMGLLPGPMIDDLTFLRRATLDLCGRIPTPEECNAFLTDHSPAKRVAAVDQLLTSDDWLDYWSHRWLDMLQATPDSSSPSTSRDHYREFIRHQLANDRAVPQILVELVLAEGTPEENGAVGFYLSRKDGRGQAELFSEAVMGVRLRCANCHDHPFDHWTQDDYHGLAALFAGIQRAPDVRWRPGATNTHPVTGLPAIGRTPDGEHVDTSFDPRPKLAAYINRHTHATIAVAWANRGWKWFLGRGLMEPEDDLRVTNPPTHPELLRSLVQHWEQDGYTWKGLMRMIVLSDAYAREVQLLAESNSLEETTLAYRLYATQQPRKLPTYVLEKCFTQVLEQPILLLQPDTLEGRISYIAGEEINRALNSGANPVTHWVQQLHNNVSPDAIVDAIYLRVYSRKPSIAELSFWLDELRDPQDRRPVLEDMIWSLLASQEFLTNH